VSKFTDHTGGSWELRLTVGSVSDVKRETGVNLALVSKDTSWVDAIFGDPAKLVEMLHVLCEPQCKAADVTPELFAHRFDGATLEAAGIALADAIADFFPRSAVAAAVKKGLTRLMQTMDARATAAIEQHISTACDSLTSAPASSDSTPAG
jgi:hypothetical protein